MACEYAIFADAVRALYRPPIRRKSTFAKVDQVLREFAPLCATTEAIGVLSIASWIALHAPRAPLTRLSLLRAFRSACRAGVALGLLEADPFAFRGPRQWFAAGALAPPERKRHHAASDIGRVLALADRECELAAELSHPVEWRARRLRALAYLAAYTGARRNELLGARVADVDPRSRLLWLRPNAARPLKTASSAAPLPIADPAALVLARWVVRCDSEWLFPGSRRRTPWLGGLPGYRPGDCLKALGERAGVEGFTFQSLRHSWATLAEGWGLGELEVQRILRHARPQTQLHYRHPDLDQMRAAVDRIRF
jgi:integrase